MAVKKISKPSALDLEIEGSVGTFSVKGAAEKPSVRVHFIQSHIRLATGGDHEEKLLKALRPVREVFPAEKLTFEQIMQRDIDDGRVSTQLIPYLLDEAKTGMVKLFPPIVVVVLPLDADGSPASYYDAVVEAEQVDSADGDGTTREIVRSGSVGSEVFELRQIIEDGKIWNHDYARLRVNTTKSALVIVDGQHRAMSLIALYRNLKGWPADVQRVAPYYEIWSKEVLAKYDLGDAKLPVMFCVFPDLDGRDPTMPKVHEACRAVFLALNKNARRVTRARNALLDDADIVSAFMRDTLSLIKDQAGVTAQTLVRLWNVELDADEDRTVLKSAAAVTGVSHLFGLIERLMYGVHPASSLNATRQNMWKSTRLDLPVERLGVRDSIPSSVLQVARRRSVRLEHSETAAILVDAFRKRVSAILVQGFDGFAPYRANNEAAMAHQKSLVGPNGDFYRSLLYDGQSQAATFHSFKDGLTKEFKDDLPYVPGPEYAKVQESFKSRGETLRNVIADLSKHRRAVWVTGTAKKALESQQVCNVLDKIYSETLTSSAFQSGFFLTFFLAVFHVESERLKTTPAEPALTESVIGAWFKEYLECLNRFFSLSSEDRLRAFIGVFQGQLESDAAGDFGTVASYNFNLRRILIPGELKPDEWTKFRSLLLELWRPKKNFGADLQEHVTKTRELLRSRVLANFIARETGEEARRQGVPSEKLSFEQKVAIRNRCANDYAEGLKRLGDGKVAPETLLAAVGIAEESIANGGDGDEELLNEDDAADTDI